MASFDIQQEVVYAPSAEVTLYLTQTVSSDTTHVEIPITQTVLARAGTVQLAIEQSVVAAEQVTLGINQSVLPDYDQYDDERLFGNSQLWTISVRINNEDISHQLVDEVTIETEENAARIATIRYLPDTGEIDPYVYIRQSAIIDFMYIDNLEDKRPLMVLRRFTGVVDEPQFDATTSVLTLQCTDDLQVTMENLERDTIDTILSPSHWSPDIFDEDVDNWQYTQDRLSTIPRSLNKDVFGNLIVTEWKAKNIPDFLLQDQHVEYETPEVTLANWRDLINEMDIEFDHRYERLFFRRYHLYWQHPYPPDLFPCLQLTDPLTTPTSEMIMGAIEGATLLIESLGLTRAPEPGLYRSYTVGAIITSCLKDNVGGNVSTGGTPLGFNFDANLIIGFNSRAIQRWTQTITERLTYKLIAPQTRSRFGENSDTLNGGLSVDFDAEEYEGEEATEDNAVAYNTSSIQQGTAVYHGGGVVHSHSGCGEEVRDTSPLFWNPDLPSNRASFVQNNYSPPEGAILNSLNDYYADRDDDERYQNAVQTIMAQARNRILESHRQNIVEFTRPILPIDIDHTIEIYTTKLHARGKVSSLSESYNIDTGSALMTVNMAISKSSEETTEDDVVLDESQYTIVVPERADTTEYFNGIEDAGQHIVLPTQIGGRAASDRYFNLPYCEDIPGYSGNYQIPSNVQREDVSEEERTARARASRERAEREASGREETSSERIASAARERESQSAERARRFIGYNLRPRPNSFPHRFKIDIPKIDDALRDEQEIEKEESFTVSIPNELLTITPR